MKATAHREQPIDFDSILKEIRDDQMVRYRDGNPPSLADLSAPRDVRTEYRRGQFRKGATESKGIKLTWTPCHFGGARPWFICPSCGYRVAILFADGCRRCKGIRYQSQYDKRLDRLRAKATAIRSRLGYSTRLFGIVPQRPKGMRRATYQALLNELESIELEAVKLVAPEYPKMRKDVRASFDRARRYEAMRDKYGW